MLHSRLNGDIKSLVVQGGFFGAAGKARRAHGQARASLHSAQVPKNMPGRQGACKMRCIVRCMFEIHETASSRPRQKTFECPSAINVPAIK